MCLVPHRHFVFGFPQDAPPVFPLGPRFAQKPLPRRPRVPDRVSAHKPGPARRRPRHRHGHSHLRRVSGFPPLPARAGGRRLFARSGVFHVMPETGLKPLEELFRARVISFWSRSRCCRPSRPGCCEAGFTRASTSTADAGCSPASARTWNGSPNKALRVNGLKIRKPERDPKTVAA